MEHPRELDQPLIEAYLARRALDYLVGFTLSPVLWRKLPGSRSAGRVQSVALRLICEREAEIEAFRPREYWTVEALFATPAGAPFTARLTTLDGKRLDQFDLANQDAGRARAAARSRPATSASRSVERRRVRRNPPAPVHHLDPAAGGEPQARLRRASRRCASRSSSTRASTSAARPSASSPICGPTACRWRARRSRRSATMSAANTAPTTCPPRRANTRARPRTPRRRTRRSARPMSRRRPTAWRAISRPSSAGSTS